MCQWRASQQKATPHVRLDIPPAPVLCAFGRAFFFWRSINARCVVVIPFAARPSLQDAIDAVHREFASADDQEAAAEKERVGRALGLCGGR